MPTNANAQMRMLKLKLSKGRQIDIRGYRLIEEVID